MQTTLKMKKGGKFISLFLVFSLLVLTGDLLAKERRGARLLITKKDGQQIKGELIAVKESSLLLKEAESGADVSVDIGEIEVIKIGKKSKLLLGGGIGLIIGGGAGLLDALTATHGGSLKSIFMPIVGLLVGGTVGAILGTSVIIILGFLIV